MTRYRTIRGSAAHVALVAVTVVVTMTAIACNKGKRILSDARAAHDAGRFEDAVSILDRVKQEAANTPEVGEAQRLAVTWLVEASETPKALEKYPKNWWLHEALRWDPTYGPTQVRLCQMRLDAKDFNALRECLGDGMKEKTDVPADRVSPLQDALKKHDAEEAAREADDAKAQLAARAALEDAVRLVYFRRIPDHDSSERERCGGLIPTYCEWKD